MAKRIAVLVRDRQAEAIRMAIGLTLMDDEIAVYVLDRKLEYTENTALNLEMIRDLRIPLYTNCRENKEMQYFETREIAQRLTAYDHILPY